MLSPIKQPGTSLNQGTAPQMPPFQNPRPGWGREFIRTWRWLALKTGEGCTDSFLPLHLPHEDVIWKFP